MVLALAPTAQATTVYTENFVGVTHDEALSANVGWTSSGSGKTGTATTYGGIANPGDADDWYSHHYQGNSSMHSYASTTEYPIVSAARNGSTTFMVDIANNAEGMKFIAKVDGKWYGSDTFATSDHGAVSGSTATAWETDVSVNADTDTWYAMTGSVFNSYVWRDQRNGPATPQQAWDTDSPLAGLPAGDITEFGYAFYNADNNRLRAADNFRVTQTSNPATFALTITPNGANYDFEWVSQDGKLYRLKSSADLAADFATWDLVVEDLPATAPDGSTSIPKPGDPTLFYRVEEYPIPPVTVFSDNFDGIDKGWTSGVDAAGDPTTEWELGNPAGGATTGPTAANSPNNCYGTNIAADYGLDTDIWLRTPSIDLTAHTEGTLQFKQFRDIEAGFLDLGSIRILAADDLAVLAVLEAKVEGTSTDWEDYSKALPAEAFDEAIIIEFRFESDEEVNQAGWYIDDVVVTVPGS
jgi:hypothetical protein